MHRATVLQRTAVVCPVCKLDDFIVNRRMPGPTHGSVEMRCTCQRCSALFVYVQDRCGRPVVEQSPAPSRARTRSRRSAV